MISLPSHRELKPLNASIERVQPPLFKINVYPQTPVGSYTILFSASLFIGTTPACSKSAYNYNESDFMKPNLQTVKY